MRLNRLQSLSWLVALTMLVQATAFGWMRPAVAEETDAPQIEGWVICTAHSQAPSVDQAITDQTTADQPQKDNKGAARHDLTCTMCAAGCLPPMVLSATDIELPLPSEAGRIEQTVAAAAQPRAPPFTLARARAPPSLS